jgi:hypothetical protein
MISNMLQFKRRIIMHNAIYLLMVAMFVVVTTANAQPDLLWSQTYGGEEDDYSQSVFQNTDGGFALAGYSRSFGEGGSDFWLVRTNEEGEELWSQTYGGAQDDFSQSVIQITEGGFALAGETQSFGEGESDFWLIAIDDNGEELWSQTYGGNRSDICYSVIRTVRGGFALAGQTNSFGQGRFDFWLVVTDENGDELWSETYGGQNNDCCTSVIQTADGGFALTGYTYSYGDGEGDFWLVRTNEDGEELWSQTYGGEENDWCYSVIQTTNGGFALAGFTLSFGEGSFDYWLVVTNVDGEELLSQSFGGEQGDWGSSVVQTVDGGYTLAGRTNSFGEGASDIWMVRTDEVGEVFWSRTFGGEDNENCNSLILTEDFGYSLVGYTDSFGAGSYDFLLVRTEPDPDIDILRWLALPDSGFVEGESLQFSREYLYEHIFSPNFPDSALIISFQNGENVFGEVDDGGLLITAEEDWYGIDSLMLIVTDPEVNDDTIYLRLTVTEYNTVGKLPFSNAPGILTLHDANPNPFNSTTIITFDIPLSSDVSITLTDLNGRQVGSLLNDHLSVGSHSLVWNARSFPTGTYLCRMEAGGFAQTKKLMLVR